MMRLRTRRVLVGALLLAAGSGCASTPATVTTPAGPQPMTFEQKMAWILRLEEDRVLRGPEPPPPPPLPPAKGRGRARAVAPPPPPPRPSLLTLLTDSEARVRRRAALAIGRTRVADGVGPLMPLLTSDPEPEVRQMAAFAMGLIGTPAAADPLTAALSDPDPLVHGRAAEALGMIAHKAAAPAIASMIAAHLKAGALNGIAADDLEYPKPPPVEAVRLGIYALVRLSAYDALASVLLDPTDRPVSQWWPIAYAFRRINDPRAGPALLRLLQSEGMFSRAFAARGLGVVKEARAIKPLIAIAGTDKEVSNVRVEAVRALADLNASSADAALIKVVSAVANDANLRLEAVMALGQLRSASAVDVFIELLTDAWPTMRAAAITALARTDPDNFVLAISGLDPDRHWSVRAALAAALGTLGDRRGESRLMEMLKDEDQRVVPAVLNALVAMGAPTAEATLLTRLSSDDVTVRQTAAAGLARLKAVNAVDALLQAYDRAEKDPTFQARAAILAAVVDLDRTRGRTLLERALADREWAIRVRAAALLKTVDPAADVSEKIRPAPAVAMADLTELDRMVNPQVSPVAYLDTTKGLLQIELAVVDAPRAVVNFIALARRNFLGATPLHRVVANFVVQDGDPRGDGEGGPGYAIRDEINQLPYLRGTVGMALDWEDTGGSQFFITLAPQPHLDGRYTVFGRVVQGMDVVDRLQQWDQVQSVRIWDGVNWIGGPK
jgi:HEAT repeat protein/cyclophilin family peptidyl-prolyl cis-trans isomerase